MRFSKRLLAIFAIVGLSWFGYSGHTEYRAQQQGVDRSSTTVLASVLVPVRRGPLVPISRDLFRPSLAIQVDPVIPSPTPTSIPTPTPAAARAAASRRLSVANTEQATRQPVGAGASPSANPIVAGPGSREDYRSYAFGLVPTTEQRACLDKLWTAESHWRVTARNPRSTAFGIAQVLGETSRDPLVQIRNGLHYISARYPGGACYAWAHEKRYGWY